MADLPSYTLTVTNLVSSSGAVRLQLFVGTVPNQALVLDMECTAAQNAALSTALAATAGTVTNITTPGQPAALPGIYNAA